MSTLPPSPADWRRSTTNARTAGSMADTRRGVRSFVTRRRKAVCAGGSRNTIGIATSSPVTASSSYATVRPLADENVSGSPAAPQTSSKRVRT